MEKKHKWNVQNTQVSQGTSDTRFRTKRNKSMQRLVEQIV